MSNSYFNGTFKEELERKCEKNPNTETKERDFADFRDLLFRS